MGVDVHRADLAADSAVGARILAREGQMQQAAFVEQRVDRADGTDDATEGTLDGDGCDDYPEQDADLHPVEPADKAAQSVHRVPENKRDAGSECALRAELAEPRFGGEVGC